MLNFWTGYNGVPAKLKNNRHGRRVLIVAGPSCVGKTTLIQKLRRGELPCLQEQLGLGELESWDFLDAWQVMDSCRLSHRNLLLHYDILRLLDHTIQGYHLDAALDFLQDADQIIMLTLWESSATLLDRCRKRRSKNFRNLKKADSKSSWKNFSASTGNAGYIKVLKHCWSGTTNGSIFVRPLTSPIISLLIASISMRFQICMLARWRVAVRQLLPKMFYFCNFLIIFRYWVAFLKVEISGMA